MANTNPDIKHFMNSLFRSVIQIQAVKNYMKRTSANNSLTNITNILVYIYIHTEMGERIYEIIQSCLFS